jgi:hypothetical protein
LVFLADKLDDRQLLEQWCERLASSKRHMEEVHERMDRWDKTYWGRSAQYSKPQPKDAWRSRVTPPFAFEQVEVLNSEMSLDEVELAYTADQLEYQEHAEAVSDAIDYYDRRDKVSKKRPRTIRWASKYGFAPVKVIRRVRTQCVYDDDGSVMRDEASGDPLEKVVFDGPSEIPWNPRKVFPDPSGTCVDEMAYVIFESERTVADLEDAGIYKNLEKLSGLEGIVEHEHKREGETEEAYKARRTGVHTIHECHTRHGVFTMANKSTTIFRQDYPMYDHGELPVVFVNLIEDPDSPFGVSIIGLIEQFQQAIYQLLNDLFDAIKLRVNPPKMIDEEADPNISRYDIHPGANIPASPAAKQFQVLDSIASIDTFGVEKLIDRLMQMMERVTGLNSAVLGVADDPTATQSAIRLRQGKGRVGSQLKTVDGAWADVAWLKYKILQQYLDERVVGLAIGGRRIEFGPEELQYDFMIEPTPASERATKDLLRQDLTTVLTTLFPVADPAQMASINWPELLKKYLKAYAIDPRNIVGDPPPPPPMDPMMMEQGAAPPPMQGAA